MRSPMRAPMRRSGGAPTPSPNSTARKRPSSSNVSHEFRTPLTLLLGPIEDSARRPLPCPPSSASGSKPLIATACRLLKLVNTLLDFSRVEAGRIRATYEPTDLAPFTRELASLFRSACEQAGLSLVVETPDAGDAGLCRSRDVGEDRPQPAVERLQVHASRARSGSPCRQRRGIRGAARRGHRHRHSRGRAAAPVRALPSHRRRARPDPRRHRDRPRARSGACRAAQGLDRGRQHARPRQHFHRPHPVRDAAIFHRTGSLRRRREPFPRAPLRRARLIRRRSPALAARCRRRSRCRRRAASARPVPNAARILVGGRQRGHAGLSLAPAALPVRRHRGSQRRGGARGARERPGPISS